MGLMDGMDISASGLMAQRARLDVISSNLANMRTTRTAQGGPYRRKDVVFREIQGSEGRAGLSGFDNILRSMKGVEVSEIVEDGSPPKMVYEPGHPDADNKGYVSYPNVNIVKEMVNMISATRSYEANVTAVDAYKNMFLKAMEISR